MSSPATWPPRGEGGVEGAGAEEAGQRVEKQEKLEEKNPAFFIFFILEMFFFVRLSVPSVHGRPASLCLATHFPGFLSVPLCLFFLLLGLTCVRR